MPYPQLDRRAVRMKPLAERANKRSLARDAAAPGAPPPPLPAAALAAADEFAQRIRAARRADRPVILAFGAHVIKNGVGPILIDLIERGWLTHLATNGAGIIHDWELAWQGETSEDVRAGVARGEFGHWHETGFYLNLAIDVGAYEGLGYGEAVGAMIEREWLDVPAAETLRREALDRLDADPERAAAAIDLLGVVRRLGLPTGPMAVPHRFKTASVQAAAWRLGVPFTGHAMIGHDIIYNHPLNHGGLLGRAALRDYLAFAHSISRIEDGVYLSVGSAVMSPMIFEKAFSMAQNLALQAGRRIERHFIGVVDLAPAGWDWSEGEPPESHPEYYLRYNKTFSRMGGTLRTVQADHRAFLLALAERLEGRPAAGA